MASIIRDLAIKLNPKDLPPVAQKEIFESCLVLSMSLGALQAGCARVVVPAECEVIHEPDTLLMTYERSDSKSAETSHNWRKVDALELAALLR